MMSGKTRALSAAKPGWTEQPALGGEWRVSARADATGPASPAAFGSIDGTGRRVIDLTGLAIADGFTIVGDADHDNAGWSVASAGDVNGDLIDDFIIGARTGDDGGSDAGEAYVIFGHAGAFASIDLTNLSAADGFVIRGDGSNDNAGTSVAAAGDVNNDGYGDIVIGAPGVAGGGAAYVVFGRGTGFGTADGAGRQVIDLTGLAAADGFVVSGDASGDAAGTSVASAGDVNGDLIADIVIGAPDGNDGGSDAGEAYVIFGHSGPFAAIDLTTLSAADGFVIRGDAGLDHAGTSVFSAGDLNADGFGDIIVGAPGANDHGNDSGSAYVIFGTDAGFGTLDGAGRNVVDLTTLDPGVGFVIWGDAIGDLLGTSMSAAGDVNGDGFADIVIGAKAGDDGGADGGEAYILFGSNAGFGTLDDDGRAYINLGNLTSAQGFVIQADAAGDSLGISVSAAGDINGDGYDDLIVGASAGDDGGSGAGEAYVIFGTGLGFGTRGANLRMVIDLTSLGAAEGFIIQGDAAGQQAGFGVSAAGDINDDGYDDLIVGAPTVAGGGAGAAYVVYGHDFSTLGSITALNDTILGTPDDDDLDALAGNDRVYGYDGNDVFHAGAGSDVLIGGAGDDTFYLDNELDSALEAADEGFDRVFTTTHFTLEAGSEVELISAFDTAATNAVTLTGNELAQEIVGNAGADILIGLGGADTLRGVGGNDGYYVDTPDTIVEAAGEGFDIAYTRTDYTLGAGVSIELLQALSGAVSLTGNELIQQIFGSSDDNVLTSGGGADELRGFAGNDIYHVEFDDLVVEADGQGVDRLFSSTSFTLGSAVSIEYLSAENVAGTDAINLTGNGGAQEIYGNAGANVIDGDGGGDAMHGLGGNDVYTVRGAGDSVFEDIGGGFDQVYALASYTLTAGAEAEVLASASASGGLTLTGNAFGQQIIGDNGVNYLDGGGGADALYGRLGDDTYIAQSDDVVVETGNQGFDIVYTTSGFVLGAGSTVEVIALIDQNSVNAATLAGNEFGQQLFGSAGDNTLTAGGGADALYGYGGNDTYVVDFADIIVEEAGKGFDVAYFTTSFTLGAGVEVEVLSTSDFASTAAINLTGNEFVQQLYGNAGANVLNGGDGADALYGFGGNDTYVVDALDTIFESAGGGSDTVYAAATYALTGGADIELLSASDYAATNALNLTGNAIAQQIFGNAGANTLDGREGADALYGFGGADLFAFTTALGGGNIDYIGDFSAADDTIALDHLVFTGLAPGALAAGAFVTGSAAADGDDRIVYDSATGRLFFDADGTGAIVAVQFATLQGNPALTASDFTVI